MSKYYRIPAQQHRSEIVVVNSRFITTISHADTPAAAKIFIGQIRAEMPDASHHVYAFRAGYGNSMIEGMSDDGEPTGTSGPPSLAVLRGADIGDIALVTTRYFGGTKLGTGGLVRAYTEAAQTALATLPTELKAPKIQLGVDIPYSFYESVKRLVEQTQGVIDEEVFADVVTLFITFIQDDAPPFIEQLTTLTAGQVQPVTLSED
jgi:uncharacterized YigZ family protein